MRSGDTESAVLTGEQTKYLGALLYLKAMFTEIDKFLMVGRDGRRIDDKTRLRLATGLRNLVDALP